MKNKGVLVLVCSFMLNLCNHAQIIEVAGNVSISESLVLDDGSIVSCGSTDAFGSGSTDLFIAKFDIDGQVVWFKTYGTSSIEEGNAPSITIDLDGNLILAGQSSSVFDRGGIVVKVTGSGDLIWSVQLQEDETYVRDCAVDQFNNIYICGTSNYVTHGGSDAFMAKLSPQGEIIWLNVVGGADDEHFTDIDISSNEIIFSGNARSFSGSQRKGFLGSVDPDGTSLFLKTLHIPNNDSFDHSIKDSNGDLWSIGYVEFNGQLNTLIVKTGQNGEVYSAKSISIEGTETRGRSIIQVGNFMYYTFSKHNASQDLFIGVAKLDMSGDQIWTKKASNIGSHAVKNWADNLAYSAAEDKLIISGYFDANSTEDPLLIKIAENDWECQEDLNPTIETLSVEANDVNSTVFSFEIDSFMLTVTNVDVSAFNTTNYCTEECTLNPTLTVGNACLNNTETLEVQNLESVVDLSFSWILNNEEIGTESQLNIQHTDTGNFALEVQIEDELTGCSYEAFSNYNVTTQPLVDPIDDEIICGLENYFIEPDAYHYDTYIWSDGVPNLDRNIDESGLYVLTVMNQCGVDSTAFQIEFIEDPFEDLSANMVICEGDSVEIFVDSPAQVYLEGDSVFFPMIISEATIYSFQSEITPCTFTHQIDVEFDPVPTLNYPLNIGEVEFCEDLEISELGIDPELNLIFDHENSTILLENSSLCYTVIDSIQLNILEFNIWIPNAFTPNEDGVNDLFRPVFSCDLSPLSYSFRVYNRDGEAIFQSENTEESWKGNYRNSNYYVPDGVYNYELLMKYNTLLNGIKTVRKNGHIVISR